MQFFLAKNGVSFYRRITQILRRVLEKKEMSCGKRNMCDIFLFEWKKSHKHYSDDTVSSSRVMKGNNLYAKEVPFSDGNTRARKFHPLLFVVTIVIIARSFVINFVAHDKSARRVCAILRVKDQDQETGFHRQIHLLRTKKWGNHYKISTMWSLLSHSVDDSFSCFWPLLGGLLVDFVPKLLSADSFTKKMFILPFNTVQKLVISRYLIK